jgi:hypothetical protein
MTNYTAEQIAEIFKAAAEEVVVPPDVTSAADQKKFLCCMCAKPAAYDCANMFFCRDCGRLHGMTCSIALSEGMKQLKDGQIVKFKEEGGLNG